MFKVVGMLVSRDANLSGGPWREHPRFKKHTMSRWSLKEALEASSDISEEVP